MKQIIYIILIFFILKVCLPGYIYAVGASPSATPKTDTKTKQIEDLKERLATKVAQLQQIQREAIFGIVKTTSLTSLTVETKIKDLKIDLTDDIKVYQYLKSKRTTLTTDDVSRNDVVTIFGDYDSTLDLMKAKIIFIQNPLPVRISGIVSQVDKNDYTISINDPNKRAYLIDFETYSRTFDYSKSSGIVKSGFSKIINGNFISVLGSINPKDEFRLSAQRILNYNPNPEPTASATGTLKPTQKINLSPTP
jgi:hypothetical protein